MAMFMSLTGVDNIDQFVNIELVTRMVRFNGGEGFTAIYFDHENSISVKETPHHVLGGLPASNLLSDDHK
jgi:hypothetical protein